jgi:predicted porin
VKRTILATLLAGLASIAQAQSSVTIYGRLDNGLQYESGLPHGHTYSAESGDFGQSEFGVKGAEDLGGGTHAIFQLEMGIDTQNGSYGNGSLFGRAATVGLSNQTFGTFKMGNLGAGEIQQDSFDVDPQLMQAFAISTLVRGRNWSQAGNGLEYTSPTFGGLSIKGQYDLTNSYTWNAGSPGSAPGQLGTSTGLGSAQGRSGGIKAQYNASIFELQAIYDEIRDQNGQFSNVYLASRSALAGGNVTLGPVKLYAGYQHLSAPNASNAGYYGTATPTALPGGTSLPTAVDHEFAGAAWQFSPAASVTAAVYHANANNGNGNATMYTLAGQYNLSRRTFLYSEVGYIHNSSTSNIGLGDGYSDPYGANANNDPATANSTTNPNYGHGQVGVFAGIMTNF